MGFLSCLSPLLPSLSTSSATTSIADPLLYDQSPDEKHAVFLDSDDDGRASEKLELLRGEMKKVGVDVYVVPTADAHGSEYVGECDKRRAWLSGFTGSAGVAVVTKDRALLFTDSRYFVQAAKELSKEWELQKVGMKDVKQWDEWLLSLDEGTTIGIDSTLVDYATAKPLLAKLKSKNLSLDFPPTNLVDNIWADRPLRSAADIVLHPLKFSGQPAEEKLSALRSYLTTTSTKPSSFLLTSLPNIAWLLNLRGSDIAFNPVFYAYLLVPASEEENFVFWVQNEAVGEEVRKEVERLGGEIREYEKVLEGMREREGKVVTDGKVSWALIEAAGEENVTIVSSPVVAAQAIKNDVEIEGFKAAYLRDGAAWVCWLAWLEETLKLGKKVSEWEAAEKLTQYRKKGEDFAGLAYENISATGENAALPHYAPTASESSIISLKTPYLNDSGAQYLDGTIDTTRTYHFGKPTKEHKRAYTRVLQGHIAIDTLVFPEGTAGNAIDVLARRALWGEGMNYLHGTGHGVGEYLSVHEGPQGIGASASFGVSAIPFVPGHIMSNEPAYYEAGSYGIRIESVIFVQEVTTRRNFGDKKWFGFGRFTQVPIQTRMVDYSLLSPGEIKWLRKHNEDAKKALLEVVKDDKRAVEYLHKQ
ncbi:peptidase M24, structural domain-containing protein [Leucosporidium creatinivorum]|uniref:Peptidase M24, structural domain-containing protein n=1 Tax=Leucosporidium creatinivorum TaxID=106004 RepID=A0A1Y2DX06_9BASI|nr:peptidase M24, structural domain-containing protein [Leucosporidium creatinivorum]